MRIPALASARAASSDSARLNVKVMGSSSSILDTAAPERGPGRACKAAQAEGCCVYRWVVAGSATSRARTWCPYCGAGPQAGAAPTPARPTMWRHALEDGSEGLGGLHGICAPGRRAIAAAAAGVRGSPVVHGVSAAPHKVEWCRRGMGCRDRGAPEMKAQAQIMQGARHTTCGMPNNLAGAGDGWGRRPVLDDGKAAGCIELLSTLNRAHSSPSALNPFSTQSTTT